MLHPGGGGSGLGSGISGVPYLPCCSPGSLWLTEQVVDRRGFEGLLGPPGLSDGSPVGVGHCGGMGMTQVSISLSAWAAHCSHWALQQLGICPGPSHLLEPGPCHSQDPSVRKPQGREFCLVCSLLSSQASNLPAWYVPGAQQMCESMGETDIQRQ